MFLFWTEFLLCRLPVNIKIRENAYNDNKKDCLLYVVHLIEIKNGQKLEKV